MGLDPDSGAYVQIGRNHHKFRNTQKEYSVQEATQVAAQFLGNNSFFLSLLLPYLLNSDSLTGEGLQNSRPDAFLLFTALR